MLDERHEFYGDEIDLTSIKYQMDFLLNQYVYYDNIEALKTLHLLTDGLLQGRNVEELYNEALDTFKQEDD